MSVAILFGLRRLERWVDTLATQAAPIQVEWAYLPDWLRIPENRHVLDDVAACTGLTDSDSLDDPLLARRVARTLQTPQVGWIRRVVRVAKQPPDRLVVHCEFRRPLAWVRFVGSDYLVDAQGVRLPGRYARASVTGSGLLDILGVTQPPPAVGRPWRGDDFRAAISVVRLVEGKPFSHQITGVSVDNFEGRLRGDRPHIELLTNRPGSRIWWGRAPGAEDATEISADRKVALLDAMFRQAGRVDMNHPRVDITLWPDRVALPAVARPASPTRTWRG